MCSHHTFPTDARLCAWRTLLVACTRMHHKRFLKAAIAIVAFLFAPHLAHADAVLTIKPITWDVIGLDSNKPSTQGPVDFPLAVRVKNTGPDVATNVVVSAELLAGGNTHLNLIGLDEITTPSLAVNQVADFYFHVRIDRPLGDTNAQTAGYFSVLGNQNTTKRYKVTADAANASEASTDPNRQLFVEKILSQNRNSVAPTLEVDDPELPFLAGQVRTFTLFSDTATGYDQQETTINFPNDVFQILAVRAVYTEPACGCNVQFEDQFVDPFNPLVPEAGKFTTNKVYVDACNWVTDFTDPDYMTSSDSCTNDLTKRESSTGKVGGTIITTYKVLIRQNVTMEVGLDYLVHDHSGSSFHYNFMEDIFTILPTNVKVTKTAPATVEAMTNFDYTIVVENTSDDEPADNVVLSDSIPPCVTFVSANPAPVDTGANPLLWNLGTLQPNETRNFTVTVKAGCTEGDCLNTAIVATTDVETDYTDNEDDATVDIQDTTPPDITCPADALNLECPADTSVQARGTATATDNCPGVTIGHVDTPTDGCGNTVSIKRTWTATDAAGNTDTCDQTITVVDTTDPTIGDVPDKEVECGDSTDPSNTGGPPSASDTCGNVTVAPSDGTPTPLCGNTFRFVRTWTATDECGNTNTSQQTITVVDTTDPTIGDVPDKEVECGASTDPSNTGGPPSASDTCGDVTVVPSDGTPTLLCGNTFRFVRTWTATDECGNTNTSQQTITVVDTTDPTIGDVPDKTVECGDSTDPSNTGGPPSASDTCGDVTVVPSDSQPTPICGNTFSFVRTWTATDECGNTKTSDQLITVEDTTPPSVTCPADINLPAPVAPATCSQADYPNIVATDACDNNVTITFDPPESEACFPCGSTTVVTVTAEDDCGNKNTCTFNVIVADCPDGCSLTQGFWKNHPEDWPDLPLVNGVPKLQLGNNFYTQAQCIQILNEPVKKNGLVALAHQLIAAKLNVLSGADSSCISTFISQADALIGNRLIPPIGEGKLTTKQASTLNNILDDFNNGRLCAPHCDDVEPDPVSFKIF